MVNTCIRIGLETNASSLKKLSLLSYGEVKKQFESIPSYYRLTAISKAAGILASRKKSIRRGIKTKDPYLKRPILVSCYVFSVGKNCLIFKIAKDQKISIPLTKHTTRMLQQEGIEIRSFTLTQNSLSISYRKEATPYIPTSFAGIDRNASNVTYGNHSKAIQFDLSKVEEIARNTRQIVRSFKRNDVRIRKKITSKYGRRRKQRISQIIHKVSKIVVNDLKENQAASVFEDITNLRNLYKKGNGQTRYFRGRMNSVPWNEIKRQIEYKAAWEGVPVIQLTKKETRGTSIICPECGERLQEDRDHPRMLWCNKCRRWMDRDIVAIQNISYRGCMRFRQSSSSCKGEAGEAMVQEREQKTEPLILKVDASKLSRGTLAKRAADEDLTEPYCFPAPENDLKI
jgi:putative transposase